MARWAAYERALDARRLAPAERPPMPPLRPSPVVMPSDVERRARKMRLPRRAAGPGWLGLRLGLGLGRVHVFSAIAGGIRGRLIK